MKLRIAVAAAVTLALCAVSSAEEKAKTKYSTATGTITAVDAAAKTITVKTRKGEKTLKIAEKTNITKMSPAKVADLAKGQMIRVMGKVAEDKKSVEARMIAILPEGAKPRGKGLTKEGALGTVESTGDTVSLKTADGGTVSVTLRKDPKPTIVLKAAKAKFEDLKKGANVQANTATDGEGLRATRLTIRPPMKRKAKAE